ncbi:unnamed protein product [Didymodactylos carnosus]|uniref:Uncharacterized protein n=1 Tax=Didymodactylos carnosus TaxID=1234261 RepID=A0A813TW39_9BILA|nr:unnamed protein product [Didymodactylos carnosus]CAF0820188.1 unnamed protein product [Didymodactylos carnosus]CAF3500586.1 unnamed protein product [Didymodactylos carnosus]CAF3606650.1 unnamed protein product [Didymodactylos carnosus]
MTTDIMIYYKKKHTPPPSVLLLTVPSDTMSRQKHLHDDLRSRNRLLRRQARQPPATTLDIQPKHNTDVENYLSNAQTYNWQRQEAKASVINMAADIVYKNTYMNDSDPRSKSSASGDRSPRRSNDVSAFPRLKTAPNNLSKFITPSSKPVPVLTRGNTSDSFHSDRVQYRTIYDYIRESIRSVVQQRNLKQYNFSTRIKRPQNEDIFLRRALDKRNHYQYNKNDDEHSSSTTATYFSNELKSPQSFVNYVNHSREKTSLTEQTSKSDYYRNTSNVYSETEQIEQKPINS